jgi:molecular chaperone DnaK (HSP70)
MYIGIDLGTTHCCISYKNPRTNQIEIIEDPIKHVKSIPSIISCYENEFQYGSDAKRVKTRFPKSCIYDAKRYIGRTNTNVNNNFVTNKMNYELENVNGKPTFKVNFNDRTMNLFPEQVSALLLSYLKSIAEGFLNKKIEGCVITVPAHFNNTEREATLFAAEMADLKVLQLFNEPSAAALSYGLQSEIKTGFLLVFDFGGGTLDVSVVHKQKDKYEVVGYSGDQILGGRDIDNAILDYCIEQFKKMYGIEHNNATHKAFLLENCEDAKIVLSNKNKTETRIFHASQEKSIRLSKDTFEEICRPFFKKAIEILEKILMQLNIEKNKIDEIVMTGGSSYIPLIQAMVGEFMGKKPYIYEPEAAIAKGAAWLAFEYSQNLKNFVFHDQVRYSIVIGVRKNDLNFDYSSKIIDAGTKIPCKKANRFTTIYDNQTAVFIKVAEGESNFFSGNAFIDSFVLENLPPGKAGDVYVDVTIEINKSGLLLVTATETSRNVTRSREMRNEGNFYKVNEKKDITQSYIRLIQRFTNN